MNLADRVQRASPPPKDAPWCVETRSLEGFLKEAVVTQGGVSWRLVSDEGPYLKGTDLAPPPLAFFLAGLQFDLMDAAGAAACDADSRYTMEGSLLRGDMKGGALPVEVRLSTGLERAASSSAEALMREPLQGSFVLAPSAGPADWPFSPDPGARIQQDIIRRTRKVRKGTGTGAALKPEQRRQLHLHGRARDLGHAKDCEVQVLQPVGSTFSFRSAQNGTAPPPLVYVSAGIAFCFMTQLGRYVQVAKLDVSSMRTVQFHDYGPGTAKPVTTHVFIDSDEPEERIRKLLAMGEQTCFLHAAMRGRLPSVLASASTL